jgi:hypothetical protein
LNKTEIILRINFWSGAIIDALMVPVLLSPKLYSLLTGLPAFNPDIITQYIMNVGATLMASLTGILIWASMKPIERKGIILITIFPVQFGLFISGINLYIQKGILLEKILPLWICQGYLLILHIISLFAAKNIKYLEIKEANPAQKSIRKN